MQFDKNAIKWDQPAGIQWDDEQPNRVQNVVARGVGGLGESVVQGAGVAADAAIGIGSFLDRGLSHWTGTQPRDVNESAAVAANEFAQDMRRTKDELFPAPQASAQLDRELAGSEGFVQSLLTYLRNPVGSLQKGAEMVVSSAPAVRALGAVGGGALIAGGSAGVDAGSQFDDEFARGIVQQSDAFRALAEQYGPEQARDLLKERRIQAVTGAGAAAGGIMAGVAGGIGLNPADEIIAGQAAKQGPLAQILRESAGEVVEEVPTQAATNVASGLTGSDVKWSDNLGEAASGGLVLGSTAAVPVATGAAIAKAVGPNDSLDLLGAGGDQLRADPPTQQAPGMQGGLDGLAELQGVTLDQFRAGLEEFATSLAAKRDGTPDRAVTDEAGQEFVERGAAPSALSEQEQQFLAFFEQNRENPAAFVQFAQDLGLRLDGVEAAAPSAAETPPAVEPAAAPTPSGVLALPPPEPVMVDPAGTATTPAQRVERQQLGITPDIEKIIAAQARRTESAPVAAVPATESTTKEVTRNEAPSQDAATAQGQAVDAAPAREAGLLSPLASAAPRITAARRDTRIAELHQQRDQLDEAGRAELLDHLVADRDQARVMGSGAPIEGVRKFAALAEREKTGAAGAFRLFFDGDNFKRINDTFGHSMGDEVIRGMGEIAGRIFPDSTFHKGGDEFVVDGATEEELRASADRLRAELAEAEFVGVDAEGREVVHNGVGISIGIGRSTDEAERRQYDDKRARAESGLRTERRTESRRASDGGLEPNRGLAGRPQGAGLQASQVLPANEVAGADHVAPSPEQETARQDLALFKTATRSRGTISIPIPQGSNAESVRKALKRAGVRGVMAATRGVVKLQHNQTDIFDQWVKAQEQSNGQRAAVPAAEPAAAAAGTSGGTGGARGGGGGAVPGQPGGSGAVQPAAVRPVTRTFGDRSFNPEIHDVLDFIALRGGLDRESLESEGIDPANWNTREAQAGNARFFGRPLFRKGAGLTADGLREALQEGGFLPADPPNAPPRVGSRDALDLLDRALRGAKIMSTAGGTDAAAAAAEARRAEIDQEHFERVERFLESVPPDMRQFFEDDPAALYEAMSLDYARLEPVPRETERVRVPIEIETEARTVEEWFEELKLAGVPEAAAQALMADLDAAVNLDRSIIPTTIQRIVSAIQEARRGVDQGAESGDRPQGLREGGDRGAEAGQGEPAPSAAPVRGEPETQGGEPAAAAESVAPPSDLFGAQPVKEQALADAKAKVDAKLTGGNVGMLAGDGELFAGPRPEQADLTKTPPATKESPAQPAAKPKVIEDFGEVLHGARKHYAEAYAAKVKDALGLDLAKHPLSQTWPEPDYDKLLEGGSDPFVVGWVHAARDEVPNKPSSSWKLAGWVKQVELLRKVSGEMLDGTIAKERLEKALADGRARTSEPRSWDSIAEHLYGRRDALADVRDRAELYEAVGHGQSLKGIKIRAGSYSMYRGVAINPPRTIWTVEKAAKKTAFGNWPREIASGDTKAEAIEAFKAKLAEQAEQDAPAKATTFEIYSTRGSNSFFIGKKINRQVLRIKDGFETVKAARAFLAEQRAEVERLWEKVREIPDERADSNAPRVGIDHRTGGDVTPEKFADAFGFRGVQFGNYVEAARRQQDLNNAYDALMDMAGVLGVPPRALSLNGELGLAFGARGKGGKNAASAHYESGNVVINLTKGEGAGSLAHEWWHALDNYFARMAGDKAGFMTRTSYSDPRVRQAMLDAFAAVNRAISSTRIKQRSQHLDDRRSKDYWTLGHEMSARSFESYIIAKLEDQGATNDYLANVVSSEVWNAQEALRGRDDESYPYPAAGELPAIRAAFDHFFSTVETRDNGGVIAFLSRPSIVAGDGEAKGIPVAEAQTIADEFVAAYNGNLPLRIRVAAKQEDLYGPKATPERVGTIKGAYHAKSGVLTLAAVHLQDRADAVRTLRHEALGHYGLNTLTPDGKRDLLQKVVAAQSEPGLREIWAKVDEHYSDKSELERAEEVFAFAAEQDRGVLGRAWDSILSTLARVLRAVGLVRGAITMPELHQVAHRISEGIRTGKAKQQTFPDSDDAQFRRGEGSEADEDGVVRDLPDPQPKPPSSTSARARQQATAKQVKALLELHAMGLHRRAAGWDYDAGKWQGLSGSARRLRERFQDGMIALRDVQEGIEDSIGQVLDDGLSVYRMENLMRDRVGDRQRMLEAKKIEPLMAHLKRNGLSMDQLHDYLLARAAPERNAKIARINADMPDGGSGLATSDAEAIIRGEVAGPYSGKVLSERDLRALRIAAEQVDGIRRFTLDALQESGMLSADQRAALEADKFYVPMRGRGNDADADAAGDDPVAAVGGRRPSTLLRRSNKPNIERALGRGEGNLPENILPEMISDAQQAIFDAELVRVKRALLAQAMAYPNPGVWEVEPVRTEYRFDKLTGEARLTVVNSAEDADSTLVVPMPNGKTYRLRFADPDLQRALVTMGDQDMKGFVRWFGAINRWQSAVFTRYNPAFVPVNLFRDLGFGLTAVATNYGPAVLGETVASYGSAAKALVQDAISPDGDVSKPVGEKSMLDFAREFAESGGKMNAVGYQDTNAIARDLSVQVRSLNDLWADGQRGLAFAESLRRASKPLIGLIETTNDAIENALRLSLYASLRRSGKSVEQAAEAAKNITVNFRRKGAMGAVANAIYLFFNAGVQGAHAALKLLRNKKVIAGLTAMGALQGLFAWMLMEQDDDDDGVSAWDAIPAYRRERSLVIPIGLLFGGDPKHVTMIPLQYGFNLFPYLGGRLAQRAHDELNGTVRPKDNLAGDMAKATVNSFIPVPIYEGPEALLGNLVQIISQLKANRDDLGRPITSENPFAQGDPPRASLGRDTTSAIFKAAATALNRLGGGDDWTPPWILPFLTDVAPEEIEFLWGQVTGGLGSTITRTLSAAEGLAVGRFDSAGEAMAATPIVNAFGGTFRDERAIMDRYYAVGDEVERAKLKRKALSEQGDDPGVEDVAASVYGQLRARWDSAQKKVRRFNKELRAARTDPNLSAAEREAEIKRITRERAEAQREFLQDAQERGEDREAA